MQTDFIRVKSIEFNSFMLKLVLYLTARTEIHVSLRATPWESEKPEIYLCPSSSP